MKRVNKKIGTFIGTHLKSYKAGCETKATGHIWHTKKKKRKKKQPLWQLACPRFSRTYNGKRQSLEKNDGKLKKKENK